MDIINLIRHFDDSKMQRVIKKYKMIQDQKERLLWARQEKRFDETVKKFKRYVEPDAEVDAIEKGE